MTGYFGIQGKFKLQYIHSEYWSEEGSIINLMSQYYTRVDTEPEKGRNLITHSQCSMCRPWQQKLTINLRIPHCVKPWRGSKQAHCRGTTTDHVPEMLILTEPSTSLCNRISLVVHAFRSAAQKQARPPASKLEQVSITVTGSTRSKFDKKLSFVRRGGMITVLYLLPDYQRKNII